MCVCPSLVIPESAKATASDADRGEPGRDERRERLDPGLREHHPERDHDDRDEDAAARVGQPDHDDPAVDEQRPGRSPAGREAEARSAARCRRAARARSSSRSARAGARSARTPRRATGAPSRRATRRRRRRAGPRSRRAAGSVSREVRADEGEREVDERAVRVVPAPVGLDRPRDREREPDRERDERREDATSPSGGLWVANSTPRERAPRSPATAARAALVAGEEDRGSRQEEGRGKRRPEFACQPHPIRR